MIDTDPAPTPPDTADDVPETIYQRWGRNIVEARVAAGLTQVQLAEKVGAKQQSISRIERGKHGVKDGLRKRIADAVGRKVEEIFVYGEGE